MRLQRIITLISFLVISFYSCKERATKNIESVEIKSVVKETTEKKGLAKNKITEKDESEILFSHKKCPCIMPKEDGRLGYISYENSLTDNQKKLVIKLCENGNNNYALSLESLIGDESTRGKIYDYKSFNIDEDVRYIMFTDGCMLDNGEVINSIWTAKGIHSTWRILKGKLIKTDKNKKFPCIDFDEGMGEDGP